MRRKTIKIIIVLFLIALISAGKFTYDIFIAKWKEEESLYPVGNEHIIYLLSNLPIRYMNEAGISIDSWIITPFLWIKSLACESALKKIPSKDGEYFFWKYKCDLADYNYNIEQNLKHNPLLAETLLPQYQELAITLITTPSSNQRSENVLRFNIYREVLFFLYRVQSLHHSNKSIINERNKILDLISNDLVNRDFTYTRVLRDTDRIAPLASVGAELQMLRYFTILDNNCSQDTQGKISKLEEIYNKLWESYNLLSVGKKIEEILEQDHQVIAQQHSQYRDFIITECRESENDGL